jgi:hypothetical protein
VATLGEWVGRVSGEFERVTEAWWRLSDAIAASRSPDGAMPAKPLAMGPSFDADMKLLDLAIPELVKLALAVKASR